MKKLKAGVVGLGMGRNHIAGYREHPDVEVVAIADIDVPKLHYYQKELAIPRAYPTAQEMFDAEELDVVSIAVPNIDHMALTVAALRSGANVLCEKPMALNAEQAEIMLQTARECDRKLGINFSYRFHPQSRAMKNLAESGALGDIYFGRTIWHRRRGVPGLGRSGFNSGGASGNWFFDKQRSGGGPLIDLGVHRLDLALWMMDYPEPEWVMANTYAPFGPGIAAAKGFEYSVEDLACAMIRFKNGAMLELEASWAANIRENELMSTQLLGTKGGIRQFNLREGYEFDVEYCHECHGAQFDMTLHPPVPECRSGYYLFADAVLKNEPFLVAPEQGVTVMRLLDAIYRSAAEKRPIRMGD